MSLLIINLNKCKCVTHQSNPEDYVLIYEAAEVLVEDEEAGAYKGRVLEVELALGNVGDLQDNRTHVRETFRTAPRVQGTPARTYHQLAGDLRDGHAEGEQVQAAVVLKQAAGRLLENDEGQGKHESDLRAGTQHTGVLHRSNSSQ